MASPWSHQAGKRQGSARNFRRLVAQEKNRYRQRQAITSSRRPALWSPGEHLVIDWGVQNGLHVFCAVLAWSRVRFRFAGNERAETTLAMLAECFQAIGGVPKVVLADRMGCLKAGVVADVVVPTPDYVRFASHYRFRPEVCHARDPESKGIVENLVGYAKRDLMVGLERGTGGWDLDAVNAAALAWCEEVNNARHSEIAAIPTGRLVEVERNLLAALPSLQPTGLFGGRRELRTVDKLSCIRFGSARYSVPKRLLGTSVEVLAAASGVTILVPGTGEVLAEHPLKAPGEASVMDEHYGRPRSSSLDQDTRRRHLKLPLGAVIHHGIPTSIARQYFHDLNILAVRPNTSLGLSMDTQDPIMRVVDDVEAGVELLTGRVEKMSRQLPRKSEKLVTLQSLRQMVINVAKGISGVQYGARPAPMEGVDLRELSTLSVDWTTLYFQEFKAQIADRDHSLAGSGPVIASVGAMGNELLGLPSSERRHRADELINSLRLVDWAKGDRWLGIAGNFTASGVFSVKGTKEVAYAVYNALTDPDNPGFAQVRMAGRASPAAVSASAESRQTNPRPVFEVHEVDDDEDPWSLGNTGTEVSDASKDI